MPKGGAVVNTQLTRPPAEAPRLLLSSRAAAAALAISERLLWSLTQPRGELPFIKIGRAKRYDIRDLVSLVDRHKQQRRTADTGGAL